MKKSSAFLCACLSAVLFAACTTEINITAKENDKIEVSFKGAAGKAFADLISSADGESAGVEFDLKQISYELAKNGFTNVQVNSKTGSDLDIKMSDFEKKSTLFTSQILSLQKGNLKALLSPQQLKNFYNQSDENIVQFLDLLLAPVFNDEVMTSEEYLETIASFYGDAVASEISQTNFKITLTNLDGSQTIKIIPLADLLAISAAMEI